jgi:putative iron-regulated protein
MVVGSMRRVVCLVVGLALIGPARGEAASGDLGTLKRSVIANYANIVHASYQDALAGARSLAAAVDAFVAAPSEAALGRTRQAWIDARVPYAQTEAYRFYDGPIDAVEGMINAWPIDENLIDYVDGEPSAGIINSVEQFPAITSQLIASLNEKDGEKNITAGFHAIEFLLWGQDLNDDGPGQRPYRDYVDGGAPNAGRRREYLRLCADLLVRELQKVADEWEPDRPANYRAKFLAMPPDQALACILKGAGILTGSELAGERLTVAYETKEHEDEHSCFSDTTSRDVLHDAMGIENVFRGRYRRLSGDEITGPSVLDLLRRVDAALATTLDRQIAASVSAAGAVPTPFDRAIAGADSAPGRIAVKAVINALRAQADSIAHAGVVLGLALNF